jgi:CarD family transcriptional regulator
MKTSATKTKAKAKKPVSKDIGFRKGDFVVYPTHGVGRVLGVETQEISGHTLHVIIINFDKDRMTLRVPVAKAKNSGLRRLSTRKIMDTALATLKGRSRIKRAMWSRRAQEYEAKINSGDLVSIAEVVRDLYRSEAQPEQSYSERQLYEAALDRMAREIAAVEKLDEASAIAKIDDVLAKTARHNKMAAEAEARTRAA